MLVFDIFKFLWLGLFEEIMMKGKKKVRCLLRKKLGVNENDKKLVR